MSSSAPKSGREAPPKPAGRTTHRREADPRLRVRRLARGADDGYRSPLVTGLKSSADAERLAEELAVSQARLERLEQDPPGLYAEVAAGPDPEEGTWLGFLIAYLCPLDAADPFASIRAARTSWASGEPPALQDVELGPRTAHDPARGTRTIEAYRAWAGRASSQADAFTAEVAWSAERRFARAYERLALPGLHRDARYDLLVTLGRLGVYDLKAGTLQLGGENETTLAAKRAFGIGDQHLLERRAAELASACELPLEALDLALYNWGRGQRATLGLGPDAGPSADALGRARGALGLA